MGATQKLIRVIIAGYDKPGRQLIESYLARFPQVEITASVPTFSEALEMVSQLKPNAAFLDISLPEFDGLSLAMQLKKKYPDLLVVFISAHACYAAEAYQLDAVDYLVKPFTNAEIARALANIARLVPLIIQSPEHKAINDRIIVRNHYEIYFIQLNDIIYIEKEHRKAVIHTKNGLYLTGESLNSLGKRLDNRFLRCHKGFIVNTTKIEKIFPIADRIYEVSFHNYVGGVPMGRQKFEELCSLVTQNVK
jgi:DNA-binding LytR/AlgR family response regulator